MEFRGSNRMPLLFPVKQRLKKTLITDGKRYFLERLATSDMNQYLSKGRKIGICVGSRGIKDISMLLKVLVDHVRGCEADPIIIPCMGSHGGATAQGQKDLLAEFGITSAHMGARILSNMDVLDIGPTTHGMLVYMDRIAVGCDTLIVVNRIKEHTDFYGETESGIQKMLAVGLGNHTGASYIHSFGTKGMVQCIPEIAAYMIEAKPIIGIGIVEDGYSEIDSIEIMIGREIVAREKEILKYSKGIKARIPFDKLDYLVVEEMGKDISGSGMDTKVIGRIRCLGVEEPQSPSPDVVVCLGLTPASHGNAAGVGLADLISAKLHRSIDFQTTFINGITTKCPERYKVPMYMESDRATIFAGLDIAMTASGFQNRIAFIRNTADLQSMYVSSILSEMAAKIETLEVVPSDGIELEFDAIGNLHSLFTRR